MPCVAGCVCNKLKIEVAALHYTLNITCVRQIFSFSLVPQKLVQAGTLFISNLLTPIYILFRPHAFGF